MQSDFVQKRPFDVNILIEALMEPGSRGGLF
jgi:hypothetical protein